LDLLIPRTDFKNERRSGIRLLPDQRNTECLNDSSKFKLQSYLTSSRRVTLATLLVDTQDVGGVYSQFRAENDFNARTDWPKLRRAASEGAVRGDTGWESSSPPSYYEFHQECINNMTRPTYYSR